MTARSTSHDPELEGRILAAPDDVSLHLVYGDWLTERGDARGELIAVQARLSETSDGEVTTSLRETEARLFAAHRSEWLGDLASKESPRDLAFRWRLGFIDSVRLGPPLDAYETSDLDFPATIASLMRLPSIDLARELVIGSRSYDDYPTRWDDVIDAMAEHGVPRGLRRLELDCGGYWDISSTRLGDLSKLYPRLTHLEELRIRMGMLELGKISLPRLRSLEIVTGGLTVDEVQAIATASWPSLERLSLCIGESDNDYGCNVRLEHLAPILAAENLGAVRHLGLCNTNHADEIAAALPSSKILPQLVTLDLGRGTFSDAGARAVLDDAAAFRHLEVLDLTHHYVSSDVAEELAEKLGRNGTRVILADPQDPDSDGDDEYRYVQISE